MSRRYNIVLKAFLNRCSEEKREKLLDLFPEENKQQLLSLPDISLEEIDTTASLLPLIHWSWFLSILKTVPPKDQKPLLATLPHSHRKNLAQALDTTQPKEKYHKVALRFAADFLLNKLEMQSLLPPHLLPLSPLNLLLQVDKKRLIELIDFLALYDLSAELRQIVETKILKKIYSFLSERERNYLKTAVTYKEPYPPARIDLEKWDGEKKTFRLMLHRIGLARLGSALSGQDPDLIWYLCHKLDSGRGEVLRKLCTKEASPAVAKWLGVQLKELL